MKYTTLGNTDVKVSKICLGTMTFGEQNTEKEAHEQLDFAVEAGINFIDTAELYSVPGRKETQGSTERFIGSWLGRRTDRDKLVIGSKIAGPNPGLSYIRNPLNFSDEQINIALEGSLKRLQTDYLDIYQLHWPERNTNMFGTLGYQHKEDEQWEDNFASILQSMDKLVRAGKIRYWGLSNETPWGVMHFMRLAEKHGYPLPVSIQNPYSLLNRSFEVGLAEIAIREHIGLLSYSPMAFGLLSGKYHDGREVSQARLRRFPKMARYSEDFVMDIAAKYIEIANKHGLSPAQMALAFVSSRPFLTSNIIGATTLAQLKENIESIDLDLSDKVIAEIDSVHRQHSNPAP